jgi:hypothetical protein
MKSNVKIPAKNGIDKCSKNPSRKALNSVTIGVIAKPIPENFVSAHG